MAAGLLGSYAFVWGFTSLSIALGVAAGVPFGDATSLAFLLALVVFLLSFCWAFAATSLVRVWAALGGGGAAMTLAAWLLSRALV